MIDLCKKTKSSPFSALFLCSVSWFVLAAPNSSTLHTVLPAGKKTKPPVDPTTQHNRLWSEEGERNIKPTRFHLDDRPHPLPFLLLFFLFFISFLFSFKKVRHRPTRAKPTTRRGGWQPLAGHSHHVVGFGRAGPAQHPRRLLAADVTVHHGGRGDRTASRRRRGHRLGLVEHADGAVLADAVGHLEGVHPEGELTRQQQVELIDGQADALACLSHQGIHLVVDADAAVARALAGPVGEPVVLVLL